MAVFDPEYKHTGLDRIGNIEQYLVNANGGSQPPTMLMPAKPTPTVLTRFQSGHGYTFSGGQDASSALNDTSNPVIGSQNVTLVTDGVSGTNCAVSKGGQTIDLTGKSLRVTYRVDNYEALNGLRVFVGDSGISNGWLWVFEGQAPSTNNFASDGEYAQITLSFADATVLGTGTRNAIAKVYLRAQDTAAAKVTVNLYAVDAIPEPSTAYPNGLITFTCDDSYASHWTYLRQALDKYGYAASSMTITDLVGTSGRLTIAQMQTLQDVHGWDICSHAYTVANHSQPSGYLSLSAADLNTEMRNLKQWMATNGFQAASLFAWPKGYYNQASINIAQQYFSMARTTAQRTPHETWTPSDLWRLRSQSGICTTGGVSLATAKAQVDATVANHAWSIFTVHDIVSASAASDQALFSDIQSLVDYVATSGCAVKTLSAALRT